MRAPGALLMLQASDKQFHLISKIKVAACKETGLVPCSPCFDSGYINHAQNKCNIIYPKECYNLALSDDVISLKK